MKGLSIKHFKYLKFEALWDSVDRSTYLEVCNPVSIFPVKLVCKYKSFLLFYLHISGFILALSQRGRKKISQSKIIDAIAQTYLADRMPLV